MVIILRFDLLIFERFQGHHEQLDRRTDPQKPFVSLPAKLPTVHGQSEQQIRFGRELSIAAFGKFRKPTQLRRCTSWLARERLTDFGLGHH